MLLFFIGSVSLASAQIQLTGGAPSGGLTLNAANVLDAIYTPIDSSNNFQPSDTTVFQGVTFSSGNANVIPTSIADGKEYLRSGGVGGIETSANAGFTNATPSTEDTNLLNLMNGGLNFNGSGPLTLTINNLAPNTSYRIDSLISLLGYDGGRTDTVAYNGGPVSATITFANNDFGTHAIYDVEDTVLSSNTGSILVTYNGSEGPFYSALVVSEIPEPSTYAMLLGGAAFLGFLMRRKHARLQV
jgi:hypothetical protein